LRWLLFLYPWLELWSLIQLGIEASPAVAMLWVLCAMVLGGGLMRWAGANSLQRVAQASAGGTLPQQLLMADFAMMLSGLLLAIPGLVSDLLAVLVLIVPLRRLAAALWIPGVSASEFRAASPPGQGDVIEGEFAVKDTTDHLEHSSNYKPPDSSN